MSVNVDLVIVGVGGQGTLLASRVLGALAMMNGLDVKLSEVHGMAQRGGSVITHVRMGEKVHSPLVELGCADAVLAFEALEALRALPFLKPGGKIIANAQRIAPMPVVMGKAEYPENIQEKLSQSGEAVFADALCIAEACGNGKAANVVMMGILSKFLPFAEQDWLSAIAECVPPKALEVNKQAFARGREIA